MLFRSDWRGTSKGKRLETEFAKVGVEVVYFPYTMHTSSTRLRQALDVLSGGPESWGVPEFTERQALEAREQR